MSRTSPATSRSVIAGWRPASSPPPLPPPQPAPASSVEREEDHERAAAHGRDDARGRGRSTQSGTYARLACRLVGAPGFEPGTSRSQSERATRLRHAPRPRRVYVRCGGWLPSLDGMGMVHTYATTTRWSGSTGVGYEGYERAHEAVAEPVAGELALSSDPAFRGDPGRLNPEQLLVLAASSCQLLSFLAVAARARVDVVGYEDRALGEMPEQPSGPMRVARIVLRPRITIRGAVPRDAAAAPRRGGAQGVLHRQLAHERDRDPAELRARAGVGARGGDEFRGRARSLLHETPNREDAMSTPTLYVCHGDDRGALFHPCGRVQKALREKGSTTRESSRRTEARCRSCAEGRGRTCGR